MNSSAISSETCRDSENEGVLDKLIHNIDDILCDGEEEKIYIDWDNDAAEKTLVDGDEMENSLKGILDDFNLFLKKHQNEFQADNTITDSEYLLSDMEDDLDTLLGEHTFCDDSEDDAEGNEGLSPSQDDRLNRTYLRAKRSITLPSRDHPVSPRFVCTGNSGLLSNPIHFAQNTNPKAVKNCTMSPHNHSQYASKEEIVEFDNDIEVTTINQGRLLFQQGDDEGLMLEDAKAMNKENGAAVEGEENVNEKCTENNASSVGYPITVKLGIASVETKNVCHGEEVNVGANVHILNSYASLQKFQSSLLSDKSINSYSPVAYKDSILSEPYLNTSHHCEKVISISAIESNLEELTVSNALPSTTIVNSFDAKECKLLSADNVATKLKQNIGAAFLSDQTLKSPSSDSEDLPFNKFHVPLDSTLSIDSAELYKDAKMHAKSQHNNCDMSEVGNILSHDLLQPLIKGEDPKTFTQDIVKLNIEKTDILKEVSPEYIIIDEVGECSDSNSKDSKLITSNQTDTDNMHLVTGPTILSLTSEKHKDDNHHQQEEKNNNKIHSSCEGDSGFVEGDLSNISADVGSRGTKRKFPNESKEKVAPKKLKNEKIVSDAITPEEMKDNTDPRWKIHDVKTPKEGFKHVHNQWRSNPMPKPHRDLTLRWTSKSHNQVKRWLQYKTANNRLNKSYTMNDVFKEYVNNIDREIHVSQSNLYYKLSQRYCDRSTVSLKLYIQSLNELLLRIQSLQPEIMDFYKFYDDSRMTNRQKEDVAFQQEVLTETEKFYSQY